MIMIPHLPVDHQATLDLIHHPGVLTEITVDATAPFILFCISIVTEPKLKISYIHPPSNFMT